MNGAGDSSRKSGRDSVSEYAKRSCDSSLISHVAVADGSVSVDASIQIDPSLMPCSPLTYNILSTLSSDHSRLLLTFNGYLVLLDVASMSIVNSAV